MTAPTCWSRDRVSALTGTITTCDWSLPTALLRLVRQRLPDERRFDYFRYRARCATFGSPEGDQQSQPAMVHVSAGDSAVQRDAAGAAVADRAAVLQRLRRRHRAQGRHLHAGTLPCGADRSLLLRDFLAHLLDLRPGDADLHRRRYARGVHPQSHAQAVALHHVAGGAGAADDLGGGARLRLE